MATSWTSASRLTLCALALVVACKSWVSRGGSDANPALPSRYAEGHARVDLGRAGLDRQPQSVSGEPDLVTSKARPPPVLVPFLCNGPSNQIYQAKLAVWAMRRDATGATLVLPPILPHYTQRRARDEPVPLSAYFEVGAPTTTHAPTLVEERQLWEGTAPPDVAAAAAATVNKTCPVFVGDPAQVGRCKKYAEWWAGRAAGRACTGGFTFQTYLSGLAALAAELARDVGPAVDAARRGCGSSATCGLVMTCYLEGFLNPAILFEATDKPGGGDGGEVEHALRNVGAGSLPEDDMDAASAAWIDAATVLKFRSAEAEGASPGDLSSPSSTTLALQLRAPDYDVIAQNRSAKPDTYCLGGTQTCAPPRHLLLRRLTLLNLIGDAIDGSQPWLTRARSAAAATAGAAAGAAGGAVPAEHAGGGEPPPPPPPITHVHLLTNDDILGADVAEFLLARGLRVTSSPNRNLSSLMQDYAAAVNAAVFWGTRSSSISANIVHARLAAGCPARTTVFWEDVAVEDG